MMHSCPSQPLPARDLDEVVDATAGFDELRGARLFVTGGTGFVGTWILESFLRANDRLGLRARAVVLTRDPALARERLPQLSARPEIELLQGDVKTFALPPGTFSHIIHGATPVSVESVERHPRELFDTIAGGTARVLELASRCNARKLLLTSSGAVYGPQAPEVERIVETSVGGPDPCDPRAVYAEGKRVAELLCVLAARDGRMEAKIARCFTFVGPRLPLDAHYAVGNFIRDRLAGGPIVVRGDGTPLRSYLYASDLATWLWTILFRGRSARPYNVGSGEPISIAAMARIVGEAFEPRLPVVVEREPVVGAPAARYVPAVDRAVDELGLEVRVGRTEAVARTLEWNAARRSSAA